MGIVSLDRRRDHRDVPALRGDHVRVRHQRDVDVCK
jgi:hypothetical protein